MTGIQARTGISQQPAADTARQIEVDETMRRTPRIHRDELKERYISHWDWDWDWDWDCMSAQAYELLMTHARDARRERATKLRRGRLLRFGAAAAMLATVAAGAVIGLG